MNRNMNPSPSPSRQAGKTMIERINTLLTVNLNKILKQEMSNANRINLYDVGEYWVAFEKSAYLLERLVKEDGEPVVLRLKNHPFPIVMQSIYYKRVNEMCHNQVLSKRTLEYLQFLTQPADESSYGRWYEDLLVEND